MLSFKKLKKSLKAKLKASNVILKKSNTFWFSLNTSTNFANAAIARPIPAPFKALPIPRTPLAVFLEASSTPFKPFSVCLLPFTTSSFNLPIPLCKSFISDVASPVLASISKLTFLVAIILF